MAVNSTFRTLAFAMRNVVTDTYQLLNAADAVQGTVEGLVAQGVEDHKREVFAAEQADRARVQDEAQKVLNLAATTLGSALDEFNNGRAITAIKEVRAATGAGLKAAKDAVESQTFLDAANRHARAKQDALDLRTLRSEKEWAEYNDRMASYCCTECDGDAPSEPLADWERELLTGN
jgi:ribosomal protein L7/L12